MSNFTRNLYAGLPPPAECLAILVGTAELTIFGLAGLANTTEFAKGFGLPIKSSSSSPSKPISTSSAASSGDEDAAVTNQKALVAALAARNLEKGLIVLAFACYWRDRKALGTVVLTGLVTTVADLLVTKWYGAQEAVFGHVIGVANCSLIGGALLYWNRTDALW